MRRFAGEFQDGLTRCLQPEASPSVCGGASGWKDLHDRLHDLIVAGDPEAPEVFVGLLREPLLRSLRTPYLSEVAGDTKSSGAAESSPKRW